MSASLTKSDLEIEKLFLWNEFSYVLNLVISDYTVTRDNSLKVIVIKLNKSEIDW